MEKSFLENVLTHELAHATRRDLLWNCVPALCHVLFFFHPLVWVGAREWRLAQESSCDELALAVTSAPVGGYGDLLLRVARRHAGLTPGLAVIGAGESPTELKRRLKAMKTFGAVSRRRVVSTTLMLAGAAVGVLVPWRVVAQGTDGPRILYSRQDGDRTVIHVMNPDGTGDRPLPGQTEQQSLFATWAPDGKRIAYARGDRNKGFSVLVANADGTPAAMIAEARTCLLPAFSPDGKQLAFAAGMDVPGLWLSDSTGAGARRITPEGGGAGAAFWTRDGKRVGYTRLLSDTKTELVLWDPSTNQEEVLLKSDGWVIAGANGLSPDGKRVALIQFDREQGRGSLRVWDFEAKAERTLMDLDTKYIQSFTDLPLPSWSPDGKSILLPIQEGGERGIYQVSEDGKTRKRLTPPGVNCFSAAWLP